MVSNGKGHSTTATLPNHKYFNRLPLEELAERHDNEGQLSTAVLRDVFLSSRRKRRFGGKTNG